MLQSFRVFGTQVLPAFAVTAVAVVTLLGSPAHAVTATLTPSHPPRSSWQLDNAVSMTGTDSKWSEAKLYGTQVAGGSPTLQNTFPVGPLYGAGTWHYYMYCNPGWYLTVTDYGATYADNVWSPWAAPTNQVTTF